MKPSLGALLFCASMVIAVQARATILPDACATTRSKFDVKTEKSKTAPLPPGAGKAADRLYRKRNQMIGPSCMPQSDSDWDGAWGGANNNNSYFAVTVAQECITSA